MRMLARLLLVVLAVGLAGGPLLAAPHVRPAGLLVGPPPADAPASAAVLEWLLYGAVAFGTVRMRDTATLAKKFVTRAMQAAPDYKTGVEGAGGEWETNAAASEAAYEQGVQAAMVRKSFGKGVRSSGAGHYVERASKLGSTRYGPGVQAAEQDWAQGFAPVAQVIQGVQLPPRGPRRSPQNQARANAMAVALGAWKESK